MNNYKLTWLSLFVFFGLACHDDELLIICEYELTEVIPCEEIAFDFIIPLIDTCYEIPFSPFNESTYENPLLYYPTFNPNNPNEFAYYKVNYEEDVFHYELRKTDLCNANSIILYTWETDYPIASAAGEITWGSNNWVGFNVDNSYNIHFVKSNGDSLMVYSDILTIAGHIAWLDNSRFYGDMRLDNGIIRSVIIDFYDKSVLDTFSGNSTENHFFNGELWSSKHSELYKVNLETKEKELFFETFSTIHSFQFIDEESLYLLDEDGIYTVNLTTSEQDTLLIACDNLKYFDLSKHSTREELLLSQNKNDLIGDSLLIRQFDIALYNPDTGEEWILDLD